MRPGWQAIQSHESIPGTKLVRVPSGLGASAEFAPHLGELAMSLQFMLGEQWPM